MSDNDQLHRSIAEAHDTLRDEDIEGFYLVTSDGHGFTEVFCDVDPEEWEYDVEYTKATRQLLLGYGLLSMKEASISDQSLMDITAGTTQAAMYLGSKFDVEYEYRDVYEEEFEAEGQER